MLTELIWFSRYKREVYSVYSRCAFAHAQTVCPAGLTSRLEKNLCVFSSQFFLLFDVSVTLLFICYFVITKKTKSMVMVVKL